MLCRLVTGSNRGKVDHAVLSMTDEGFFGSSLDRAGVPLTTLGMRRGVPSLSGLVGLVRVLRRERPDVLQTWLYHADLMGLVAGSLAGVPHIAWNLRCSDMDMSYYSPMSRTVLRLLRRLSSWPDAVIVNSEAGRRTHERLGYRPRRWEVIPNGFDLDRYGPSTSRRGRFWDEIGAGEGDVVIGMVARLDPQKDHGTFLDAAARIAATRPEARFVLIGRGCEPAGALSSAITERGLGSSVRLLGERTTVADDLAGFDIAVLSSTFGEGCPNALGEAMASGVPVVATDVGDARRIVGDTGLVVTPGDSEELAAALERLIAAGREVRKLMGSSARARIAEHFALPAIVAHYEDLYLDLTGC